NGMCALKTGNAVIFAPHPKAQKCTEHLTNEFMNIVKKHGGPDNLIQTIKNGSVQKTQELMQSADVVVATGGGAMVKSAYSSGKPSYGVGAGNVPVIIDRGVDFKDAVNKIVTGAAFGAHDMGWVESNSPADGVTVREVTSARAVINLCGPLSRTVLERVVEDDVSNAAFPHATGRVITIGSAPVLALRVGYHGELGWELHVPTEYATHVYDTLREAGADLGIVDVGYRAIDTLRMEKGYLYWSTDITPDTTPWEAGLGWRVDLSKPDFIGRDALVAQKAAGASRRLCTFTLGRMAYPVSGEAITVTGGDGAVVGFTTSANFGHTVGSPVVYGYVPTHLMDTVPDDGWTIEVYGEQIPAVRHRRPLHDPTNARLKS
ncbi:MAG: glycine cleavage T C-terminal barrel domain-containing protein, partial [Ilumatobacteraceae bacterium]